MKRPYGYSNMVFARIVDFRVPLVESDGQENGAKNQRQKVDNPEEIAV